MSFAESQERISWRIPGGESTRFASAAVRTIVAAAVVMGISWVFGPVELRIATALALLPLTLAVLFWFWRRSQRADDNVWLDAAALHWRDGQGNEGRLDKAQTEGFRIGLDPETVRATGALTLILVGGLESQPVELHPPATPECVRGFLAAHWEIREQAPEGDAFASLLRRALAAALSEMKPQDAVSALRATLIPPQRMSGERWRVFSSPQLAEIDFDPATCRFQFTAADGRDVPAASFESLPALVEQALPADPADRGKLLENLTALEQRKLEAEAERELEKCGLSLEHDTPHRTWRLSGRRDELLSAAARLAALAEREIGPEGARLPEDRIGGELTGFSIRMAPRMEGVDGNLLQAGRQRLRDLAAEIRCLVEAAPCGEPVEFVHEFNADEPWRFEMLVLKPGSEARVGLNG